jgi:hypothetical protein
MMLSRFGHSDKTSTQLFEGLLNIAQVNIGCTRWKLTKKICLHHKTM